MTKSEDEDIDHSKDVGLDPNALSRVVKTIEKDILFLADSARGQGL